MDDFPDRLSFLRTHILVKTQGQMGADLGIAQGQISNWERGKVTPSLPTIVNIASVYNVDLNWLLRGKGPWILLTPEKEMDYGT